MSLTPEIPQWKGARRRRFRRLLLTTCLPSFVIVVAAVLSLLHYDRRLSAETEELRAERQAVAAAMEAAGLPVSDEAWTALYPEPVPEGNAAPIYEEAFANIVPLPAEDTFNVPFAGELELEDSGVAYPAESLKAMRAYLVSNQAALILADSAVGRTRVQFETYGMIEGETTGRDVAKALVALLSLRLELMGIKGEVQGFPEAVRSLHAAVQMLDESPDPIDALVALKMRREFCLLLTRFYARHSPTEPMLAVVDGLAWRVPGADLYARNTAHGAGQIEFPEQAGMFLLLEDKRLLLPFPEHFKEKWATRILEGYWLLDFQYRRDVLGLINETARDAMPSLDALKRGFDRDAPEGLTTFNVPVSLEVVWITCAYDRMLGLANAIERYRLGTGVLPESLDVLVSGHLSALPIDPYDGQPIRYRREGEGYVLYCLGVNLADDGGVEYRKRTEQEEKGDITLSVYPLST
jgi:hypothetical protein